MGTSVNQRSPDTSNWRIAQRAYENPNVPLDRALREIWRAAGRQPEGDLAAQLSEPFIGSLASVASGANSAADASRDVGRQIVENKAASLGAEIAKRAAMQSAGKENPEGLFVERLFMEATNYLVSRDLHGYITPGGRLSTVADAQAFKREIMSLTSEAVRRTGLPSSFEGEVWSNYVKTVIAALKERQR